MRKNANRKRMGGSAARPPAVMERNFLGEEYRRYVKRYGRRRSAEGAFSGIKRHAGRVHSVEEGGPRLKEAPLKVVAYNRLLMA